MSEITVLVVDDSDAVRTFVCKVLKRLGWGVLTASDGEEAVRVVEKTTDESPLQLILMDLYLPTIDGIEATKQIRRIESEKNSIPTIIVAMSSSPDKAECIGAGMNDFIVKPVTVDALEKLVGRYGTQLRATNGSTR